MKIMMYLHSGSLNRGCEALVRSATLIVKEKSTIKDSKLFLSSFLPESDKHLKNIESIYDMNSKSMPKLSLNYLIAALKIKLFKDETFAIRKSNKVLLSQIPKMDVFLSIGGDAYCYGEQPIWYEINRNIKKKGKKMVLWGCSIGEEDMSDNKLKDLKNYDLILARESITYNMLKGKGLDTVRLVADGAFLMEKEELPFPQGWVEGNTIGLNFSPLVYKKNQQAKEAFSDLIQHILDTTDMQIAFTPHVTEKGNDDFEILTGAELNRHEQSLHLLQPVERWNNEAEPRARLGIVHGNSSKLRCRSGHLLVHIVLHGLDKLVLGEVLGMSAD